MNPRESGSRLVSAVPRRPRRGHSALIAAIVAVALLVGGAGCDWLGTVGGRTVQVELGRAPNVEAGLAVYAARIEIGVTGTPEVVSGKVVLPVHLYRRHGEAVSPQAVFVLGDDPHRPGRLCFVVYDLGPQLAAVAGVAGHGKYRGFASVWELALVIGREAAQELVGEVWKTIDDVGRELSESLHPSPTAQRRGGASGG